MTDAPMVVGTQGRVVRRAVPTKMEHPTDQSLDRARDLDWQGFYLSWGRIFAAVGRDETPGVHGALVVEPWIWGLQLLERRGRFHQPRGWLRWACDCGYCVRPKAIEQDPKEWDFIVDATEQGLSAIPSSARNGSQQ